MESLAIGNLEDLRVSPADLEPFDTMVHTAGMAGVSSRQDVPKLHAVNVTGTLNLARHAAQAGVRRFVFLSSAKVGGEITTPGRPLQESNVPAPLSLYGKSKLEAEQGLERIAESSGMEVTILRPPLVYGAGVGGNVLALAKAVDKGLPLPLGKASNLRSVIGVRNLADAILLSLRHPQAANQCYYLADQPDRSTAELLRRLGDALDSAPRMLSIPPQIFEILAGIIRKRGIYEKLFESFQVDSSLLRRKLGWTPPFGSDQELREFASYYKARLRH